MALTIENGNIVAGANSFTTVSECRAFCDERGLSLPSEDAAVEKLLINAADFIFSLETEFQGVRKDSTQDLPFPREKIFLHGADVSGTIPNILKQAQSRLAFDAQENDLFSTGSGKEVLEEQVGPLKTKYSQSGSSNPQNNFTAALNYLEPLFKTGNMVSGWSFNIPVSR